MKKLITICLCSSALMILLLHCEQPSPIDVLDIPDANFKNFLIREGVDVNGDDVISMAEAEEILCLKINSFGIRDLKGLEGFTHLDTLIIRMNSLGALDLSPLVSLKYLMCTGCDLTSLDISGNVTLEYLDCSGGAVMSNQLSVLDLSENRALKYVDCSENQLTHLDLSGLAMLKELHCGRNRIKEIDISASPGMTGFTCNNNLISHLDLSHNLSLTTMISCGNQLAYLDVSHNTALKKLGIDNMPMLTAVCVWTTPFPPPGVVVLSGYSPNVVFSADCLNQ